MGKYLVIQLLSCSIIKYLVVQKACQGLLYNTYVYLSPEKAIINWLKQVLYEETINGHGYQQAMNKENKVVTDI